MAADIKRDQWGRPMVPHPETGKIQPWTRATTLAGTISDRFALEKWARRGIVRGLSSSEQLILRAVAAGEDREGLDSVAEAALEAAGGSEASAIGTALHTLTERLDAGEKVDVPATFRPDVEAYRAALAAAGLVIEKGWIERFVVVPAVEAAGTADRLFRVVDEVSLPMIGDLKTGANAIKFGSLEIAAQLAIYSRATHWWDGKTHHLMPKVDQAVGIVAHMPARAGTCELYTVDLNAGWKIALLCFEARKWRKASWLTRPLPAREGAAPEPVAVNGDEERVRERVREIAQALEGAALPVPWPAGVVPPKRAEPGSYSEEELARIVHWCDRCAPLTTAPAH